MTETNWGGNYHYQAEQVVYPESVEQIQEIVRTNERVKGLGSRHSFNSIADTPGTLVSFARLNKIIGIDETNHSVTLEAGVTYGQLCPYLDERGYALPNLASLPHITVVGSVMTGTHGSGVKNGNLATPVIGLEFIDANGELYSVSDANVEFFGMVVGLGTFGLVTRMTLRIVPRFEVWQQIFTELPHAQLLENYNDIVSSAYSVSLFTSWQHAHVDQVWIKGLAEQATFDTFFGATQATEPMHMIPGGDIHAVTEQFGRIGRWYERLPHFRLGFQPSSGQEIQSEYFIGIENAVEVIEALNSIGSQIAAQLYISELRTIAGDDFWLSPCYKRPSIAFHFTWKPCEDAVRAIIPLIEEQLMRFEVRPHWGKVYTLSGDYVRAQYERFSDFDALVRQYDPNGKFSSIRFYT